MKLVFSPRAVRRLREVRDHIASDNPPAAARVIIRIRQSIEMLADHPASAATGTGAPGH